MSRYQRDKTNLDFTEARDSEWQWHQLGHMQVCTVLQTDNHTRLTRTPPLCGCPSCRPTNSVKALKAIIGRRYKIDNYYRCSSAPSKHDDVGPTSERDVGPTSRSDVISRRRLMTSGRRRPAAGPISKRRRYDVVPTSITATWRSGGRRIDVGPTSSCLLGKRKLSVQFAELHLSTAVNFSSSN